MAFHAPRLLVLPRVIRKGKKKKNNPIEGRKERPPHLAVVQHYSSCRHQGKAKSYRHSPSFPRGLFGAACSTAPSDCASSKAFPVKRLPETEERRWS